MTKQKILEAGIKAWRKDPASVTASNLARVLGLTHPAILYHFPKGVKDAVADYAVKIKDKKIMAQLIVVKHKAVASLSAEEKRDILGVIG